MSYNVYKNEASQSYAKNRNLTLKLADQTWPFFLATCPVFWFRRLAVFRVKRDCCRRLERIDTGEDVGREKSGKNIFLEFFFEFSKK